MPDYYDDLETRDPQRREVALIQAVCGQVAHAIAHAPGYAELLAGVEPRDITSADAIAGLPVMRKSDLVERQRAVPPFGGLVVAGGLRYLFASPGPIYEPAVARSDYWRFARALYAVGVRAGDIVHNAFSYHLTPAGAMGDSGCHAIGAAVIPAGTGNTEQQVRTLQDLRPGAYLGTPSFLAILCERAEQLGADISSLDKALVSGEALPPPTRRALVARGIATYQAYATADLGLIAYESAGGDGLILDEGVYVEIVAVGSGRPVADGEVGEVVVTTLNPDYPLLRFATGDLSAILPGLSGCGRTNRRIRGWLGRADQTAKVRGMFVHPTQVAEVVQRHPEIIRARLVIDWHAERDRMILKCETAVGDDGLVAAVVDSIRDLCKVRGEVLLVAPGSLPNDGVVIEDAREYG